jgi:hypothetical protein
VPRKGEASGKKGNCGMHLECQYLTNKRRAEMENNKNIARLLTLSSGAGPKEVEKPPNYPLVFGV